MNVVEVDMRLDGAREEEAVDGGDWLWLPLKEATEMRGRTQLHFFPFSKM